MSFQAFAEQHGLIIDHLVYDRWTRVPTLDYPKKRNGSYIFDGQRYKAMGNSMAVPVMRWIGKRIKKVER